MDQLELDNARHDLFDTLCSMMSGIVKDNREEYNDNKIVRMTRRIEEVKVGDPQAASCAEVMFRNLIIANRKLRNYHRMCEVAKVLEGLSK